jgi:hypothetical protein
VESKETTAKEELMESPVLPVVVESPEVTPVSDIPTTESRTEAEAEESLVPQGLVVDTLGTSESVGTTAKDKALPEQLEANNLDSTASSTIHEIQSIDASEKDEPDEITIAQPDAIETKNDNGPVEEIKDNIIVANDPSSIESDNKQIEAIASDDESNTVSGVDSKGNHFGRIRSRFLNNHNVRLILAEYQNAVASPSILQRDENNVVELKLKRSNRTPVQRLVFCLLSGFTPFLDRFRKESSTNEVIPEV